MFNWVEFNSEFKKTEASTMESGQSYRYHELDSTLIISMKLFEIFKIIVSSNLATLNNLMKNTFSLGYLMELNMYAKEIWPLKKIILDVVNKLYINDKISLGNLEFMVKELKEHLMSDLKEFENKTKQVGLSMSQNLIFYSPFESI